MLPPRSRNLFGSFSNNFSGSDSKQLRDDMCSSMCTHFHPFSRKNEAHVKHLKEQQILHTFKCDGIVAVVRSPHAHPIESVHVRITGKVQNVRYLTWAAEHGNLMSIDGWIRNVKDGSVEAVFSGKSASVDKMLDLCKTGPSYARVKLIEAEACDPPRGAGFHVLSTHDPSKSPPFNKEEIKGSKIVMRRESSKFKFPPRNILDSH